MKFKKEYKSLPLITLTVAVIALLAADVVVFSKGGPWWGESSNSSLSNQTPPSTQSVNISAPGMGTYINTRYGFTLTYPNSLEKIDDSGAVFRLKKETQNSTQQGFLDVYVVPSAQSDCMSAPLSSNTLTVNERRTIKINDISFFTFTSREISGEDVEFGAIDHTYKTFRDKTCYEITVSADKDERVWQGNANDEAVDQAEIFETLDPVAMSFDFTSEGPSIRDYNGDWFKISYPYDFIANPPVAVGRFRAETDEAKFTSPDGSAEFFVYSPQWSGEPTNYLSAAPNETVLSNQSSVDTNSKAIFGYPYRVTRYITFAAKDGSYKRSAVSIKTGFPNQEANFHLVFGIKYKDQASYDRYLQKYLDFKASLVQYAD
jgi:hypothetical protein